VQLDPRRSDGLDAIRGAAVGLVLIWHIIYSPSAPIVGTIFSLSWSGVDLFFVLSGFLIGGILIDNREQANFFSVFYARRAIRILPLYALLIAAFILYSRAPAVPYLTFTQNFLWASQGAWGPGFTGATWSLAVEEQFYLVLPLFIRLCPQARLPFVLIPLICAAPAIRIVIAAYYGNAFAPYLLLPGRMDALLLGVLAAWLMRSEARTWLLRERTIVAGAALLLACPMVIMSILKIDVLSFVMQSIGYTLIDLFYFAILLLVVTSERRMPALLAPLRWMGIGAYSLYLFHLSILIVVSTLLARYMSPINTHLAIMITLTLCAVVSFATWRLIERPLINLGHRSFRYGKRDSADAHQGKSWRAGSATGRG
jgi:peptidoglycan/LPS O-acetylase OafA/YrhL